MPVRKCAGFLCAKANFIVYPVGISVYFCYNEYRGFKGGRAMKIEFTKMHGAGNDYVYVDCTKEMLPTRALFPNM